MSNQESRLLAHWSHLVPRSPETGRELVRRYAEPTRRYHNLDHLQAVLDALDGLRGETEQPELVMLAAWFHDAVYDVKRDDNEEQSALLAQDLLATSGLPAAGVAEVARLVRLTAGHDPHGGDANGGALCDADLAVLAGGPAEYTAYVAAVRAEYAFVDDATFRLGRAAVLEQLLALPALFNTSHGRSRWEPIARGNVLGELSRLTT